MVNPYVTELLRPSKKINVKPGKPTKITAPVTLPTGSYFLLIHLDPDNALQDVNPSNNTFTTPAQLTVS
ncbi:MAG TPA: hypothetical protein VIM11_28590 [Tepidisphaeraceae bacterium]|jgi:hypothetical protein